MKIAGMYVVTQNELDSLVERIKKLVEKYGGSSEKLSTVRTWYAMLCRSCDHPTMAILEGMVEDLEREARSA